MKSTEVLETDNNRGISQIHTAKRLSNYVLVSYKQHPTLPLHTLMLLYHLLASNIFTIASSNPHCKNGAISWLCEITPHSHNPCNTRLQTAKFFLLFLYKRESIVYFSQCWAQINNFHHDKLQDSFAINHNIFSRKDHYG